MNLYNWKPCSPHLFSLAWGNKFKENKIENIKVKMDFKEYQEKAKETAMYPRLSPSWIYPALGVAGESGEIMEKLKKLLRDDDGNITEEKLDALKKEIGDVLWYLAALATELELSLNDIAEDNIKKLQSRKERGVLHKKEGDYR